MHTLYIFVITNSFKKLTKNWSYNKKKLIVILIILLMFLLILFSPVENIYDGKYLVAAGGLSSYLMFIMCFILILVSIIAIFRSIKVVEKSKIASLFMFIFIISVELILNIIGFKIVVITLPMTLVSFLMFHTIENPDLKMVRQLQLAQKQMEKSNQIKEEFLSSMSHEIRTPLNAIVGCSQLIEYADTLEEAKENAKDIVDSSNTLLNMYSNMLDIYSLEADNIEIVNKLYNPKEEFNKLLSMFEYRINEKNLKLNIQIDNIPNLIGDVNIIKKVLINVIDNAIKYTEKGSITFTAEFINNELNISIEDTGKGIKKENLDKLFTNFERLDYKDSNVNGMGLGLSLSKNLLELIGGSIKIESLYEKGTRVQISVKQEAKNESINS